MKDEIPTFKGMSIKVNKYMPVYEILMLPGGEAVMNHAKYAEFQKVMLQRANAVTGIDALIGAGNAFGGTSAAASMTLENLNDALQALGQASIRQPLKSITTTIAAPGDPEKEIMESTSIWGSF